MGMFKKKTKPGQYSMMTEEYKPAALPHYGQALETFFPSAYSMNSQAELDERYKMCEAQLNGIMATCDKHSKGNEANMYIDGQMKHQRAFHEMEIARNNNQKERIHASQETRAEMLERKKAELEEQIEAYQREIEPLKGLRAQFALQLGSLSIPLGLIITILAMVVDAVVNFSFLQTVLLGNALLLMITVICMSVMSDGSMMALGMFMSRKDENFISKPIYYMVCAGLLSMFLLSVVTSVMVRYGSMDATFGTVNAAGEFVGKDTYNLAEYGVTLVTAFVTTATGLLSFAFSLDKNAHKVDLRKQLEVEKKSCEAYYDAICAELLMLEKAPDLEKWDQAMREAAENNLEALQTNLKLHLYKMATLQQKDANFTEKMTEAGEELMGSVSPGVAPVVPVSLTKAS